MLIFISLQVFFLCSEFTKQSGCPSCYRPNKLAISDNSLVSFTRDKQYSKKFCKVLPYFDDLSNVVTSKSCGISQIGNLPVFLFSISLASRNVSFSMWTSKNTFLHVAGQIFGTRESSRVVAPPLVMTPTFVGWVLILA